MTKNSKSNGQSDGSTRCFSTGRNGGGEERTERECSPGNFGCSRRVNAAERESGREIASATRANKRSRFHARSPTPAPAHGGRASSEHAIYHPVFSSVLPSSLPPCEGFWSRSQRDEQTHFKTLPRNSLTTRAGSWCSASTARFIRLMSTTDTRPASLDSASLTSGCASSISRRASGTASYGGKYRRSSFNIVRP